MLRILFICCLIFAQQLQNSYSLHSESRFKFSNDIFREIAATKSEENFVISPTSVQTCSVLAYLGAKGKTADILREGLHLNEFNRNEDVIADYQQFHSLLAKGEDTFINTANRIFVSKEYDVLPAFNEMAKNNFNSGVQTINFNAKAAAAAEINEWVESQTAQKIKNLVSPDIFDDETAALLVNAIHLKGRWFLRFDRLNTKDNDFTLSNGDTQNVTVMFRPRTHVLHVDLPDWDAQAIQLPLKNSELRVLIFLPNNYDGLAALEQKFLQSNWPEVNKQFEKNLIDVYLPRFKIEYGQSLVEVYKKLGMADLFDSAADFSGMLSSKNTKPLELSDIVTKTYFEVNEDGVEAAASTYMQFLPRSGRVDRTTFKATHPFMFAILDDEAVYFVGHLVKFNGVPIKKKNA